MRIQFLGTSHGIPEVDRYCSATVLDLEDRYYLIDAGAPVADLLLRNGYSLEKLKGVFVTHWHGDHMNGLTRLVELACWAFQNTAFDVYFPEKWVIRPFADFITSSDCRMDEDRIQLKAYEKGVIYQDDRIQVTALPTRHLEGIGRPSYGFMIEYQEEGETKRLFFSGDLHHRDAADFPTEALTLSSQAVICEMAHFGPEDIFPRIKSAPTQKVIFNHVYDPDDTKIKAILHAGDPDDGWNAPVFLACDGDILDV